MSFPPGKSFDGIDLNFDITSSAGHSTLAMSTANKLNEKSEQVSVFLICTYGRILPSSATITPNPLVKTPPGKYRSEILSLDQYGAVVNMVQRYEGVGR